MLCYIDLKPQVHYDYHEYDDYGGYDDYGDYNGDVIAGKSMEAYQERDVILSDVVPPQTDPDMSSADPRPSLTPARASPAADYLPAYWVTVLVTMMTISMMVNMVTVLAIMTVM